MNKTRWYLHRLLSMSPVEIRHRFDQWLAMMQDRWNGLPTIEFDNNNSHSWEAFLQESESAFFFCWEERPSIQQTFHSTFRQEYQATMQTAESLLSHNFQLFDKNVDLGDPLAWQADPLNGKQWPNSFYAHIDTRDGTRIGGVKWVWELNRHHHFVTLGKAYFLSEDERFAGELCSQWQQWIMTNPPLQGVNWTSSLELALRLINWAWALAFIRRSPTLTKPLFAQIMQSTTEQAIYISRHLSKYSSANNHLIGEATGLAITGLAYPWLPEAKQWQDIAFDILERELSRQISTEGVTVEQASSYLAFVLDFNLLTWRLADINGYDAPALWQEKLAAASEFIAHIMDSNGYVPAIGDSDDAWVIRLDDRQSVNNYRSILATAAAILNRPDLKSCAGRWDEKSHWLLGESSRKSFESLPATSCSPTSRLFKMGGYGVMRSSNCVVVADFGPLGYLSTAAHGHADALNVLVSLDGFPLLVDPGTFAYQEGGVWRDYFRSTAAHNTIMVDGRDQSEMKGTFLWGQKANASLLDWQTTPDEDLLMAEHDGYLKFGVIHRRVVIFHKSDWLIIGDELLGKGSHQIEQFWHFHPAWRVKIEKNMAIVTRPGHQVEMAFVNGPEFTITLHEGETDPIQGWYSAQYGHKEPAPVICSAAKLKLPGRFSTIFALNAQLSLADHADTMKEVTRRLDSAWEQR